MLAFLLIALAVGALLLVVIAGSKTTKRVRALSTTERELVRTRWQNITTQAAGGGMGLRNAISEADKLFDYVMKAQGISGSTMAERLKRAQVHLSNRESVWQAHKLRNALAHEMGFEVPATQASAALHDFERGLRDLGALR